MNVLFFCNLVTGKIGAFEGLLLEIGRRLRRNGGRLAVVLAAPPAGILLPALEEAGVEWRVIEGWAGPGGRVHPWRFCLPAWRLIRECRPDLVAVHFGNEMPALVSAWLSRVSMRARPVWVWHQRQQIMDGAPITRRLSQIRLAALGMDHFVVSYEGGRRSLERRGIAPARISSIYNAVGAYTSSRPKGWLRAELGLPADVPLVVNVGWLVPRKRIELSIAAFAEATGTLTPHGTSLESRATDVRCGADVPVRLNRDATGTRRVGTPAPQGEEQAPSASPAPHLLIVGDGPERAALGERARQLGLADRVHFLGQRPDVRDILPECDVLVHSSIAETCTNVVIESMAAGIPAAIMDAGAAREQIEDEVSGYVVGPQDVDALAACLGRLLADAGLRRTLGARARARWAERFCVDITAEQHVRLYQDLVQRR